MNGNVGIGTTSPGRVLTVTSNNQSGTMNNGTAVIRVVNTDNHAADNRFAGVQFSYYNGAYTDSLAVGAIGTVLTNTATQWSGDIVFGVKANSSATSLTEYMRIATGGNVGIGTAAPGAKLEVDGTIINDNSAGGFARRGVKVQGASGAFTTVTVDISLSGAGGYTYRIQTGGTGGGKYQTGGGYTNGTANFSHSLSSGSGFTVSTPSSNVLRLVSTGSVGTHPVCMIEVVGSLSQAFSDSDITITFN